MNALKVKQRILFNSTFNNVNYEMQMCKSLSSRFKLWTG